MDAEFPLLLTRGISACKNLFTQNLFTQYEAQNILVSML